MCVNDVSATRGRLPVLPVVQYLKIWCYGREGICCAGCLPFNANPTCRFHMLKLSSGSGFGEARLVDGSADPGGEWKYGRLEVLVSGVWSIVDESESGSFGRLGAEVACRSLNYSTGAQLVVGESSPFPAPSLASITLVESVQCDGSEMSLSDCDLKLRNSDYDDSNNYSSDNGEFATAAVALICTSPSGAYFPIVRSHAPDAGYMS